MCRQKEGKQMAQSNEKRYRVDVNASLKGEKTPRVWTENIWASNVGEARDRPRLRKKTGDCHDRHGFGTIRMKHEWEHPAILISKFGVNGFRRCLNCGIEQQKDDVQSWGRIVGYRWWPLAGRCKGKKKRT